MKTAIECPNCQTRFSLPESAAVDPTSKLRCGQCQHVFELQQGLVAEQPTEEDDFLIHDNMAIDDDDSLSDAELDSLDSLSAWVDQQVNEINTQQSSGTDGLPSDSSTTRPVSADDQSPTADEDESWLESLLREDKQKKDNKKKTTTDTNLAELLDDYGIETLNQNHAAPTNFVERINARFNKSPTTQQLATKKSPMVTLLWTLGCGLLLLLLFAQYILFNLDSLVKNPKHAQHLQSFCAVLSCQLPNADIQAFAISHLNYRASKVSNSSTHTDIMAAINNHSQIPQLYPNLKVSIWNGNALHGEFIAEPKDYIGTSHRQLNSEQPKLFMFTVPTPHTDISHVEITPFY